MYDLGSFDVDTILPLCWESSVLTQTGVSSERSGREQALCHNSSSVYSCIYYPVVGISLKMHMATLI